MKTIRWVLAHEPIELFLRAAKRFKATMEVTAPGRLNYEILTLSEYADKYMPGKMVKKNSKSIIPTPFWWCSLCGGLITFGYAYHIKSFPFMLAQFIGIIVYLRNIYLIIKANKDYE